jgi:hypothetical protein
MRFKKDKRYNQTLLKARKKALIRAKKEFLLINGTIYPFDILVTTACDQKVYNYIEKNKKYKLNDEEKDKLLVIGTGRTTQLKGGQVIVRVTKIKDLPILVHELEHAVWFIFTRIGIEHTDASDEAFAYFQAYLLKEVLKYYY